MSLRVEQEQIKRKAVWRGREGPKYHCLLQMVLFLLLELTFFCLWSLHRIKTDRQAGWVAGWEVADLLF